MSLRGDVYDSHDECHREWAKKSKEGDLQQDLELEASVPVERV